MGKMNLGDLWRDLVFRFRLSDDDLSLSRVKRRREHASAALPGAFLINPDKSRVWGFDCSHWNGIVNMQTAKANGAAFVIVKAKDGTVTSQYFAENYAAAKTAGLIRGVYCWLYPSNKVSVTQQAQSWYNIVKNDWPDLPVFVDYEWTYYAGAPANPTNNDLDAAATEFTRLSGKKLVVYTSAGYISQVGPIQASTRDKLGGLWVAHYGTTNPSVPATFTNWLFHQASDQLDGTVVGYDPNNSKAADLDYWHGTLQELYVYAGKDEPVDPPIGEPSMAKWKATVLDSVSNLGIFPEQKCGPILVEALKPGDTRYGNFTNTPIVDGIKWLQLENDDGWMPLNIDGGESFTLVEKNELQPAPDIWEAVTLGDVNVYDAPNGNAVSSIAADTTVYLRLWWDAMPLPPATTDKVWGRLETQNPGEWVLVRLQDVENYLRLVQTVPEVPQPPTLIVPDVMVCAPGMMPLVGYDADGNKVGDYANENEITFRKVA